MNNILWIIWYKTVVKNVEVLQLNMVFVKDDVAMRWFVSIGWGIPFVLTATYSVVRYTTKSFTEKSEAVPSGQLCYFPTSIPGRTVTGTASGARERLPSAGGSPTVVRAADVYVTYSAL
ncbi:hypothetical protein EVAR_67297_1 [Eumeta japonica]|uniref:G-protein coupled receptors family 2 profile 2 domain-containing protein n=1 Tax=Eumeta variegata TaxID=151549 RepID=A0A4C1SX45_EUMVA|nr:hypothetical protein EVAR_67297_1 [Eumeta japonica]